MFVGPLRILEERKVYDELSADCRKKKGGLVFETVEYHPDEVSLMSVFVFRTCFLQVLLKQVFLPLNWVNICS